jgi:putative aminopeptidase FrvX
MENNLLKDLSDIPAFPGEESNLHDLIKKEISTYADEVKSLKTGSIFAIKLGSPGKCSIMLDAHIDEVGGIISGITENGFLRFQSEFIDEKILPGLIVEINGKQKIKGIIGIKPPHLETKEEQKKAIPIKELYIDCGLNKKEIEENVSIGDSVTFLPSFTQLNGLVSNKALDDRIGAYIIIEMFKRLKKINHIMNVIGHFSSQEEFSTLGAITSTYVLKPDFAIAIDVTHATSPYVSEREGFEFGKGPAIFVGPITDRVINKKLFDTANKYGIPLQKEVGVATGTDATYIQTVEKGVPVGVVSIPLRYMHTPVEVSDPQDIEKAINLLSLFIQEIDSSFMEVLYGEH